jgi:histidine ammonia-lyase
MKFKIGEERLNLEQIAEIVSSGQEIELSEEAHHAIEKCRTYLDSKLNDKEKSYYGINTGFGSLCNIRISDEQIEKLQENLILSHAAGMGEELQSDIVKIILLLKVQNFCFGHSGVSIELVENLIRLYNADILPVIYEMGSLGASGDLAPLAHLSLMLLGEGEVYYQGVKAPAAFALQQENIPVTILKSKEGLALINGTQFSSGIACWLLNESMDLIQKASLCAAISLEAFNCSLNPFSTLISSVRDHEGHKIVSEQINSLLDGSDLFVRKSEFVQDPYSFRCIPQVHGASLDVFINTEYAVETEINSVTDNPLIFPDEDQILSGGNFHGQPIAIHLDSLAIALAELGNISERRSYQLLNGERGLPPFLAKEAGLNSGLMISQYTAASMVSQNKQYCSPASIDSIPSSAGQEDHVSMSSNAATKAIKVLNNVKRILAIEMLIGMQALEFRKDRQISEQVLAISKEFRKNVAILEEDRLLKPDLEMSLAFFDAIEIM